MIISKPLDRPLLSNCDRGCGNILRNTSPSYRSCWVTIIEPKFFQDLLFFRGFFWNGDSAGKGKGRKAKKGGKNKWGSVQIKSEARLLEETLRENSDSASIQFKNQLTKEFNRRSCLEESSWVFCLNLCLFKLKLWTRHSNPNQKTNDNNSHPN